MSKGVLRDKNLKLIFIVTLLAVMGVASIAPVFPKIIDFFHITKKQVGLLITYFTVPGIVLPPIFGVIADRIGRKKVLIPSLFLFGISGFLCVFARNFQHLLWLRFFQGIGAASLGSLNVTLIGDLFSGNQRAEAMGYNASVLSIGTALYPAIGGMLALAGWYMPFVLPLLAIPLGIYIAINLEIPKVVVDQNLLQYLFNTLKKILNLNILAVFIVNIMIFLILYGVLLTYFPIFLKEKFNGNSLIIGLSMSLMSLTTAFTSFQNGKLSKRFSQKKMLFLGMLFYTLSLILIAYARSWWMVIIPIMIFGLGHGINIPTIQTLLVGYAPMKERAGFMSINSMVLRIGQSVGPPFMAIVYGIGSLKYVFFAGAGIAILMALMVTFIVNTGKQ